MTNIDKYLSTIHKFINKMIALENSPSSNKMSFFSFIGQKRLRKGSQPFLIVVYDSNRTLTKKKLVYGDIFHKLTHSHILIFNEKRVTEAEQARFIEDYISRFRIKYVFVLHLPGETEKFKLYTQHDHVLTNYIANSLTLTTSPGSFHLNRGSKDFFYSMEGISTIEIELGNTQQQAFLIYFTALLKTIPYLSLDTKSKSQILKIDYRTVSNVPLNRIDMSVETMAANHLSENDYVILFNPQNGLTNIGCVKQAKVNENNIRISTLLKKTLKIRGEMDELLLHPLHYVKSNRVMLQQIESISSGHIIVSDDIYQDIQNMQSTTLEIVNGVTSSGLDIGKENIVLDPDLPPKTMRMNFLQRQFLNFEETPDLIPKYHYDKMVQSELLDHDERRFFEEHYDNGKIHSLEKFEEKQKMKKILKKVNYYQPYIYPSTNVEAKKMALHRRVIQSLLDFFIRDKHIALNVIRPYSTDETHNTIRLTKSVMKTLGVDESDIVELHYRGRTVSVQVLEFDSLELINETNIITSEGSINISVGVPAHIRSSLGIKQIGKVAVVSREMTYLLKKSLNLQFLPFVAVTFTVLSFSKLTTLFQFLIIIILLPLASYMSLSPIRERIPKKKRGYNGKK